VLKTFAVADECVYVFEYRDVCVRRKIISSKQEIANTNISKKYGPVVSDKKIFENWILKTYFLTPWPTYATNKNHLNNFCKGHPRDHSCLVSSNSHKRFKRRSHLQISLYNSMSNCGPRGGVNFDPRGIIWTILVEDLSMMLHTKHESSWPCSFRQEIFWKLHFENLFSDPVTNLCNQLERFEQLW